MSLSHRRVCGVALALAFLAWNALPARAADSASAATLSGVVSSADGVPVAGAVVTVRGSGGELVARTARAGTFAFGKVAAGSYAIRVEAPGYDTLANRTIGVDAGAPAIVLTLQRSSSSLVTIGRVQANGGDALSTSTAPTTTVDAQVAARRGYTRVSDVLQDDIATTLVHPLGGSNALPTSVALRGPDPTETLVDIDGHQVNNGNTGDFDLSLLDPADFGTIELVKGISPSSLVGPDTIDGAINIRTLEPTVDPHGLLRLSGGSYGAFGSTLQATGTIDRLGYALSLHRTTTAGEVNQSILDTTTGSTAQVGSAVDGSTALGKIRYAFGRGGDSYAQLTFHDQSQFRDLSAALTSIPAASSAAGASGDAIARLFDSNAADGTSTPLVANGLEGTTLQAHNAGYGIDLRTPLGAPDASGIARTSVLFRHYSSLVSDSVTGPGAQTSSYLYNDRDAIDENTLELDRQFAHAALTLQVGVRSENLTTDFLGGVVNDEAKARIGIGPFAASRLHPSDDATGSGGVSQIGLGQTERSAVLRYAYDPTPTLHLTAATYYSDYSVFGTSLDPRFGIAFDPDSRTVVRASAGTTFQAPQLPELYVAPELPNPVGGYISVGNPNLRPDRATEYGFGIEHVFETGPRRTDLSLDLYRVNLRNPAAVYLPELDPTCGPSASGGDGTTCPLSYPINAGDAIYRGIEIAGQRQIAASTTLRAGYAVRSAFLTNVPASIQDGSLVVGEQTLGLPLQKWNLSVRRAPPLGFGYDVGVVYEGLYNELNQPQFAVINAGLGYRFRQFEVSAYATNLTNVYDQRFTQQGAGVAYGGLAGPIATDAYALQGTAFTLSLTRRF